jgi:NADPH-dependent glutamate synthase beta subunit-like oxidoreductase
MDLLPKNGAEYLHLMFLVQLTRTGVFAGGDAVTGAATVILAMEDWA